jgi:pyruvate dehydrogenase E2 component (dihydrolipoamide acetyltransferase)
MAKILEMPKLSPTMEEGVLSAWHKKEGDAVAVDDLLAEVETDKATMEFRAFDQGTILKLLVAAGANVKLGQPVAVLGSQGEDISELVAKAGGGAPPPEAAKAPAEAPAKPADAPAKPAEATPSEAPKETARNPQVGAAAPKPEAPIEEKKPEAPAPKAPGPPKAQSVLDRAEREREPGAAAPANDGRVLASPYIRKVAREKGIDLQGAHGSGPGGRIALGDLEQIRAPAKEASTALAKAAPAAASGALTAPSSLLPPEVRPLSMMRKTIARRLTEAKRTVPHFYLTIDVDASKLVELRERINEELAKSPAPRAGKDPGNGSAPPPDKISINDLLVKACAVALTRVPECNAQFTDEAILVFKRVDISVAVAIPDGLVTPVVRNADAKSVVAIAREVRDLAARARSKKLSLEEMSNGTFSISNLGMFGVDSFSAVINPPEGAILAAGRVRDEPVITEGRVAPGKRLALTLSCDHRVVDGAVGAAFLAELRGLLENPMRVLTG